MTFSPQFSDALTSHFASSSDTSRASHSSVPFTHIANNAGTAPESGPSSTDSSARADRRRGGGGSARSGVERRQFGSSHSGLTDDGRELANAIDHYKLQHRRRYITCDEMLVVLRNLGYTKSFNASDGD